MSLSRNTKRNIQNKTIILIRLTFIMESKDKLKISKIVQMEI